jgi:uncharacterized protein (TIGR02145 family)
MEVKMKYTLVYFALIILFLIGCDKKSTEPEELPTTVTDIDGNVYQLVKIGAQLWMAENLKVTHYRNGDAIPNVTDSLPWTNFNSGAYCDYENNTSYASDYGHLYNWYALKDTRGLAPEGWHVPSDDDWLILEGFVNGYGSELKESGTAHWILPNEESTNGSGFSAIPGGLRDTDAVFL